MGPAAPVGKLRHSPAQGPQLLGACRGERGTLLAAQGVEGPHKPRAQSALPTPAPAKPKEQPKVISKTLRGLFKAAAGGRARAGEGAQRVILSPGSGVAQTPGLCPALVGRGAKPGAGSQCCRDSQSWVEGAHPRLLFLGAAVQ